MATKTAVSPLRRSANYQPTLWDNDYIQSLSVDSKQEEEYAGRIEKLKEDVRRLIDEDMELVHKLKLIDVLGQLVVVYYFEEEIKDVLGTISRHVDDICMAVGGDLYATALLFRLLREHGFDVSHDVFNRFKDETGSFKSCLSHDTGGLLSFYKASYLATEGENTTLDEARDFTTKHLKNLKEDLLEPCLREQVTHALELPLNWRMQRLHTRWFIEIYERDENMNPVLIELAKLDFNVVQSTYKRELKELSRWWVNLDLLGDKLSFARYRLVESYFWAVGFVYEPKFGKFREAVTKAICFITAIDDVYDVYGSLDELELFTEAIDRWEVSVMEQLPEYMKICFLALFNTTNDTAYKILKEKGVDIIPYLKRAWTDLCKTYLVEANWYHQGYTPTLEEYLENAWISISAHIAFTIAYCVNEDVTIGALECFVSYPDIIRWSAIISRLCDDLGTSTAELRRSDVPKCIQCYMHEKDVSEAVAHEHISKLISNNWKKLNGDRLAGSPFEKFLKSVTINIPRAAHCNYQHGDGYAEPDRETKDRVISLLIEPILL